MWLKPFSFVQAFTSFCPFFVQEWPVKCWGLHQIREWDQSDQTAARRDNQLIEKCRREGSAGGGVWTAPHRYVFVQLGWLFLRDL